MFGGKKITCGVKETEDGLFAGAKLGEEQPVAEEVIDICDEVTEPAEVEAATVTLFDAFNRYISANRETLATSTIKSVENIRDKHLQGLMNMNVFDISDDAIQLALDLEANNGISASTVKKYRQTVKKVIAACD